MTTTTNLSSEMESGFQAAMVEDPHEVANWAAFTDWLLDQGDPRGEALRLYRATCGIVDEVQGQADYERLWSLLASGVRLPLPRWTSSLAGKMVWVPPGEFWMGGGNGKCGDRLVKIERPFYLGIYPVTQRQWLTLMGSNPSRFGKGGADLDRYPVEQVSWEDVQEFLRRLNAIENSGSGWTYRLPTEEEWEYACRSPVPSPATSAACQTHCGFSFYLDNPTNDLSAEQANFDGNYPVGNASHDAYLGQTSKVGSYRPNGLGLYDLHGNVWEWTDTAEGSDRVIRGGGWYSFGSFCTAAFRNWYAPEYRVNNLGFRLALARAGRFGSDPGSSDDNVGRNTKRSKV